MALDPEFRANTPSGYPQSTVDIFNNLTSSNYDTANRRSAIGQLAGTVLEPHYITTDERGDNLYRHVLSGYINDVVFPLVQESGAINEDLCRVLLLDMSDRSPRSDIQNPMNIVPGRLGDRVVGLSVAMRGISEVLKVSEMSATSMDELLHAVGKAFTDRSHFPTEVENLNDVEPLTRDQIDLLRQQVETHNPHFLPAIKEYIHAHSSEVAVFTTEEVEAACENIAIVAYAYAGGWFEAEGTSSGSREPRRPSSPYRRPGKRRPVPTE